MSTIVRAKNPAPLKIKRGAANLKADMWVLLSGKAKLLDEERLL